jgi:hypothetical protein
MSARIGFSTWQIDIARRAGMGIGSSDTISKLDLVGVDDTLPDCSRRTLNYLGNFNGEFTLCLFITTATQLCLLRWVWKNYAQRLKPLEILTRHGVCKSLRPRGNAIEIPNSILFLETDSETQPWVALALIGETNPG